MSTFNRSKLRGVLLKILWILAIVEAGYLVVANIALQLDAIRRPLREGQGFALEYRSAWTVIPTLVHTRGLRIRAQHQSFEWMVSLEKCRFRVKPFGLFHKYVRFAGIRGQGVVFRLRPRLEKSELAQTRIELLPPIAGFPSPPMRDNVPAPKPGPDAQLWNLELINAKLDLREIWLAELHYLGDAKMSWAEMRGFAIDSSGGSGARFRLGFQMALADSILEVRGGHVLLGAAVLIAEPSVRLEGTLSPVQLAQAKGLALVRFASGTLRANGTLPDLRVANFYLADATSARVLRGRGTFRSELHLVHGVEQTGSTLSVRLEELTSSVGPFEIASPLLSMDWGVNRVDGQPLGALDSQIGLVQVRARDFDVEPANVESIRVHLHTGSLDHSKPPTDLAVRLGLPHIAVRDLRLLNAFWEKEGRVQISGGSATGAAAMDIGSGRKTGTAQISMRTQRLSARMGGFTLRGHAIVEARASDIDLHAGRAQLKGSVEIADASVSLRPQNQSRSQIPWWAKLSLSGGQIRFEPALAVTSALDAQMRDIRFLFDAVAHELEIPDWVRPLGNVENVSARARLSLAPGKVSLDDVSARAGNYHILAKGTYQKTTRALALVTLGVFSVGLELAGGHHYLHLAGASRWFHSRVATDGAASNPGNVRDLAGAASSTQKLRASLPQRKSR